MVDPRDHYWIVAGDETRVWSSAAGGYVVADDPDYLAWSEAQGDGASRIANAFELDLVLRGYGLSLGRALTAGEALQALTRIDAERVKAALGRDAIEAVNAGDADRLFGLATELQRAGVTATEIEGVVGTETVDDRLAELTLRFEALDAAARMREAELIEKGVLAAS